MVCKAVSGGEIQSGVARFAKILSLQMAAVAEIRTVSGEAVSALAFTGNPEFDLLIACCAGSSNRIRRIISRPIDWDRVLELVDHHRVVPRVYGQLSAFADSIPAKHLDALRKRYQDNARKALWFGGELVRVLTHLESVGIGALPLKGPVLAANLYGEVTQRQFGDLDILVHADDVIRARAALLDVGYKAGIALAANLERAFVRTGYEWPFDSAHGTNLLELQWQVLPRFYSVDFDVPALFERADEITFNGCHARTLCAEDLLLVLCVHAAKHVGSAFVAVRHRAANKIPAVDWDAIQAEGRRLGIDRIVGVNLLLAHRLLGSALPSAQKPLREDSPVATLADEILSVIERSVHYNTESLPYFRLMMRLRERWRDRARFLWRLAATPSMGEWSTVQLPKHAGALSLGALVAIDVESGIALGLLSNS